jgi:hypothetical protein
MVSKPRFGLGIIIFVIGVSIGSALVAGYFTYGGSGVSVVAAIINVSKKAIGPLVSALTLGVGGVIATYVWWRYRKPELKLGDPIVVRGRGNDINRPHKYRINIKNGGRRAATNCKAKLALLGEFGTERYMTESLLQWSQGEQTISINAGEEALVEILAVAPRSDGGREDDSNWKVTFTSGLPEEDHAPIESYDTVTGAFEEIWTDLARDDLLNTDFARSALIVTAENCRRQEFRLEFQDDDPLEISVQPA